MSRYVDGLKANLASKQRWSAAWKKAAKRHRRAKYLAWISLLSIKVRYRDSWHWSRAWKRAAKRWRRNAKRFQQLAKESADQAYGTQEHLYAKLAEQRGRYDKLLAEHEALQALLYTLDKEKEK